MSATPARIPAWIADHRAWLGFAARLVVGVVWLVAGWIKLFDPDASAASVRAYELLPGDVADQVGYLLPALEVVLGVALITGLLTRGAAVLSALLQLAFIIGIASVWARGMQINCGCFSGGGSAEPSNYPLDIARDTGLLLLSVFVFWVGRTRLALDSLLFRTSTPDPTHDPLDEADGARDELVELEGEA